MRREFKIENLPIEIFASDLRDICGNFETRPSPATDNVWGGVSFTNHMGVEIAHVANNSQQILRTPNNIKQDDGENYFLIMQEDGYALMGQEDRFSVLYPGDMVLIDSSKPSEFSYFGNHSCQLSLHLPRTDLEDRFGTGIIGGMGLSRDDPTAIAIRAIISKVLHAEETHTHLREALFSLVGVFIFENQKSSNMISDMVGPEVGSVLQRCIGYIETRYSDPEFSASMIAHDLNLQPHQVQRAFKSFGTTATKYLLAKRLELARNLLSKKSKVGGSDLISTIAYKSGFSDISYFNRRFREVFDTAPGDYS